MGVMDYSLNQLQQVWPVGEHAYYRGEDWTVIGHRAPPWSNGLPYLVLRRHRDGREACAYWWDLK